MTRVQIPMGAFLSFFRKEKVQVVKRRKMIIVKTFLLPLFVGILIGIIFSVMKLPVPTPERIEGVIGVVGIFLGMLLVKYLLQTAP